jgi:hypothetical protein
MENEFIGIIPILTEAQKEQIREDLRRMGIEGSPLEALGKVLREDLDAHTVIRTLLLAFLRALFRSLPDSSYHWDPDPTKSKVVIQYADPRSQEFRGNLPTISLELAQFAWGTNSIGMRLFEFADGTSLYTDLRNGSAVIRCRSSSKLEADSLAFFVKSSIHFFWSEISALGGFVIADSYSVNQSSPELIGSNTEGQAFVASVVLNIHYQESWKKQTDRKISKVVFNSTPEGEFLP